MLDRFTDRKHGSRRFSTEFRRYRLTPPTRLVASDYLEGIPHPLVLVYAALPDPQRAYNTVFEKEACTNDPSEFPKCEIQLFFRLALPGFFLRYACCPSQTHPSPHLSAQLKLLHELLHFIRVEFEILPHFCQCH